ncbi:MAG TPA: phenylalanine--tRNA ligase subunit alpha [Gemmatimonadales bacterium]|jgi:phenylalanyl-tRNA synthetase alpha chain
MDALRQRLAAVATLDAAALEAEEVAVLGRKQGELTRQLKEVASLPLEEKRVRGAELNILKTDFEAAFSARRRSLAETAAAAAGRDTDLTMPGRRAWSGSRHPVTIVIDDIVAIFREIGFSVALGPEIENDERNFTALNFPPDHPALDMHDTLFLEPVSGAEGSERLLMRTHTSPVQIRVMREGPPPFRVVIPGVAYRNDPFDASHAPAFSQIEGLAVDEGISFVDLKATLTHFAERFLGGSVKVRFRPSFFPFTEPSAEMDVSCAICGGKGCGACKGTGWMEILGCGMVHERVLQNCGIDPERFTGFAFGMGPQRMAMVRYGIPDIRLLYGGDMRFLAQFGAVRK